MGFPQKFDLMDLSGSLNEGVKPTHIADNEYQELKNMYQFPPYIKRRKGVTKLTTSAFSESIRGLFALKLSVGTFRVIAAGKTIFGFLDGTGVTQIPHVNNETYTALDDPWSLVQYKDTLYGARRDAGSVNRSDGFTVGPGGIPAPSSGGSAAEGAAGALPAGTYKYVVTFFNVDTEAEGNYSEEFEVTISASKRIDLSALPTSTNHQVSGRRIYRTTANQSGEYFFVGQINDNFSTTFEDNVVDADLGLAASLDNGLPPGSAAHLAIWRQRLWVSDTRDLWFSRAGFPESFAEDFLIPVFPDDGHELRGIAPYGNRLLVGKTNKMHFVVGIDEQDFELQTLSDKHGLASHHSMQVAEGIAFWFEGTDFFLTDGSQVIAMGRPYVQDSIAALTDDEKESMVSWVFPELKWYCTTAPESGIVFVANYKDRTWSIFEHGTLGAPHYAGEFADENFGRVMYCVFDDGHIYQWHRGQDDAGEAITCRVKTKSYGFDANAFMKAIRRINILTPRIAETLTARLYRDTSSTVLKSDTINLNARDGWKRANISNVRAPGATVNVELEYTGMSDFEIHALAFEMVLAQRQPRPE